MCIFIKSVSIVSFPIKCCMKILLDFSKRLMESNNNVVKFHVHTSPFFSCRVIFCNDNSLVYTVHTVVTVHSNIMYVIMTMYVYMYVCMYVCMHACMYVCIKFIPFSYCTMACYFSSLYCYHYYNSLSKLAHRPS